MPRIPNFARFLSGSLSVLLGAGLATAQTYRLSALLPRGSDASTGLVGVTPDGSRMVVQISLEGWGSRTDLFSIPVDGSGEPVALSLSTSGLGEQAEITADGSRVVFLATDGGLYSSPLDGSQPPLLLRSGVEEFRLSPTGGSVVYAALGPGGFYRVYAVPADGSTPNQLVSGAFEMFPYPVFEVSPDWSRVVFRGKEEQAEAPALVSARIDGASEPVRITPPGFDVVDSDGWAISFDSLGVAFLDSHWNASVLEHISKLYVVSIDGAWGPFQRNGSMIAPGSVTDFFFSAVSDLLVFRADRETNEVFELYAVHAIPGGAPVKLNAPLPTGNWDVYNVVLSPDAAHVSYSADSIYVVRTDGSSPAVPLAPYFGSSFGAFHGDRAVYREDGDLYSVLLDGNALVQLSQPRYFRHSASLGAILSDGTVLFAQEGDLLEVSELFKVPIDGSASAVQLAGPLGSLSSVRPTPAEDRIVYMGAPREDFVFDVYSVLLSGGPSLHLTEAPLNGDVLGGVQGFSVSADGSRTVYAFPPSGEVHCVANDRSHSDVELSNSLGGDLGPARISPDGSWVVYAQMMGVSPNAPFRIFAAPSDGSQQPILLSGPTAPDVVQQVSEIEISPDGASVVFLRSDLSGANEELCIVPIDGSEATRTLHAVGTGESFAPSIVAPSPPYSFDSASGRIVYAVTWAPVPDSPLCRLYSVSPVEPEAPLALTPPVSSRPSRWVFSCVDGKVLYHSDQETAYKMELFCVPADGSASSVKLNQPLASGRDVRRSLLSPDATRAVFFADADLDERFELYSAPTDGSGPVVKLNGTLVPGGDVAQFAVDPASAHVVYMADQEVDSKWDLYGVPIAGGAVAKLSGATIGNGVYDFAVGAGWVAFRKRASGLPELFSTALDGSSGPLQINFPLPSQGEVREFQLTPDGARVVFEAHHTDSQYTRLFLAPLDGTMAPEILSPALQGTVNFQVCPDDRRVIYTADLDGGSEPELYASLFARPFRRATLK